MNLPTLHVVGQLVCYLLVFEPWTSGPVMTLKCGVLDIDECSTSANTCRHACKNLIGSFVCTCPTGYRQIPGSDECRGTGCFLLEGLFITRGGVCY